MIFLPVVTGSVNYTVARYLQGYFSDIPDIFVGFVFGYLETQCGVAETISFFAPECIVVGRDRRAAIGVTFSMAGATWVA